MRANWTLPRGYSRSTQVRWGIDNPAFAFILRGAKTPLDEKHFFPVLLRALMPALIGHGPRFPQITNQAARLADTDANNETSRGLRSLRRQTVRSDRRRRHRSARPSAAQQQLERQAGSGLALIKPGDTVTPEQKQAVEADFGARQGNGKGLQKEVTKKLAKTLRHPADKNVSTAKTVFDLAKEIMWWMETVLSARACRNVVVRPSLLVNSFEGFEITLASARKSACNCCSVVFSSRGDSIQRA